MDWEKTIQAFSWLDKRECCGARTGPTVREQTRFGCKAEGTSEAKPAAGAASAAARYRRADGSARATDRNPGSCGEPGEGLPECSHAFSDHGPPIPRFVSLQDSIDLT